MASPIRILAVLALALVVNGQTVKHYRYDLADSAAASFDDGKYEHHCIMFSGDVPVSVVGTYGNFGYFEGTFMVNTRYALLSWWETATSSGLAENVGGAWVEFSTDYSTVSGAFGGVGVAIKIGNLGSYLPWKSINGQLQQTSDDSTFAADAQKYCLLSKSDGQKWADLLGTAATSGVFHNPPSSSARSALPNLHRSSWTSNQGSNAFCIDNHNIGSYYEYTYSSAEATSTIKAGDKETGVYLKSAIHFEGSVGEGLVGVWTAKTGPISGSKGPNLYLTSVKPNGKYQLIGFYCNTDGSGKRTACFQEQYDFKSTDISCNSNIDLVACFSTGSTLSASASLVALASAALALVFAY